MDTDNTGDAARMTDVVPLPDSLNKCLCKGRPTRHLTDCRIAVAFDRIDIRDRPEYEEGRRFACVSWEYPFQISANISVEVSMDPVALIVDRADEYAEYELDPEYEDWEKPVAFLVHLIEEQCDFGGLMLGPRRIVSDRVDFDAYNTAPWPEWTEAHTAQVDEALARRVVVDPNQERLLPE